MRVLIIGESGQLARTLASILKSNRAEIGPIPEIYNNADLLCVGRAQYDLSDESVLNSIFGEFMPEIVFNCAAYTDVDGAEKNEIDAIACNATLAGNIATSCARSGARLLHVSTDYVFSGNEEGERTEFDKTNPVSAYGRSKQIGEMLVRRNCVKSHVVRTSWLFGQGGKNFVETMIRLSRVHDELSVVDDQFGNPTSANDLAFEMTKIVLNNDFGIWHCTGEGICSWADFAQEIMNLTHSQTKINRVSTSEYKKLNPSSADRPKFSALKNLKLETTIGNEMRDWHLSLAEYIENRCEHTI